MVLEKRCDELSATSTEDREKIRKYDSLASLVTALESQLILSNNALQGSRDAYRSAISRLVVEGAASIQTATNALQSMVENASPRYMAELTQDDWFVQTGNGTHPPCDPSGTGGNGGSPPSPPLP